MAGAFPGALEVVRRMEVSSRDSTFRRALDEAVRADDRVQAELAARLHNARRAARMAALGAGGTALTDAHVTALEWSGRSADFGNVCVSLARLVEALPDVGLAGAAPRARC